MVAYVPGWYDPMRPRWVLLFAVVPMIAMMTECRRITTAHAWGTLFLAYAALSLAWTPNGWDGLNALAMLVMLAMLFHIGGALETLEPIFVGAALGFWVNSAVGLLQAGGIDLVARVDGPTGLASGLFMNRDMLAEPAALVLVWLVANRRWWLALGVLPSVLPLYVLVPGYSYSLGLPLARGALLGLTAAAVLALRPRWLGSILLLVAIVAGAVTVWIWPHSLGERFLMWGATVDGLTLWGNGIGSFYTLFSSHAPAWDFLVSRPMHPHNDFLEIGYELGLGVLAFLAVVVAAARGARGAERYVLLALIVEACFAFPLRMPAAVFVAGLVAGRLCRDRAALRDVCVRRGMELFAGVEWLAQRLGARPLRRAGGGGVSARWPQ